MALGVWVEILMVAATVEAFMPPCGSTRCVAARPARNVELSSQQKQQLELSDAIRSYAVDGSSKAFQTAHRSQFEGMNSKQILERSPALVLNSDYQPLSYVPLSVWSWQDAIKAVFMDRVVVVAEYSSERVVRSANLEMRVPSVIALRSYQKRNMNTYPHFTRRNVYTRDLFTCQYCMRQHRPAQLTYDHVIPRCRGGETSWENVVTACTCCNNKKGNLLVKDFAEKYNIKLNKPPKAPSHGELLSKARRLPLYPNYHETWSDYVGTFPPSPQKDQHHEDEMSRDLDSQS